MRGVLRRDATSRAGAGRPALQVVAERGGWAALLAIGLCCAGAVVGVAVTSAVMGAIVGAIMAFLSGVSWLGAVLLTIAGVTWLAARRRPPSS